MKRLINFFTRLCEAYMPDAFVFCLLLTLVVFGLCAGFTPHGPSELIGYWGKEFWSINAFAMQMVFVLISGHMLATSPVVHKLLLKLSMMVKNETQGLLLLSFFSTIACFINWGFGLIVSGILAIELAKKLKRVNFGLFIATAYAGFLVWHGGLSGSIPLKIAANDDIVHKVYPGMSIPLSETVFSNWNMIISVLLFLIVPFVALMMRTDEKNEIKDVAEEVIVVTNDNSLRDKLENSRIFHRIFFIFFLVFIIQVVRAGEGFDINRVNFVFLFMAMFFHQTPKRFLASLQNSIGFASGIVIQFPFYAGIMGLMQHSGMGDVISQVFVQVATPVTLPIWTFLSGAVVNFFVPSGGGQWVVQGPIMLKAAKDLGVEPARIAMALAWGDGCTNMIQPFWTLPLLSLAKIQLKDIMGYCLIFMFASGLIISGVFLFL